LQKGKKRQKAIMRTSLRDARTGKDEVKEDFE